MAGGDDDARIVDDLQRRLTDAAAELAAGNARDEALAEFVIRKPVLFIARDPVMRPLGRVWRLGVLLLEPDGRLRATGKITRAVPPRHPGHQSVSAEERRDYRRAAFAGTFAAGETVNHDTREIDLDADALGASSGPLVVRTGRMLVRWSASVGPDAGVAVDDYLAERIELLLHPPPGA